MASAKNPQAERGAAVVAERFPALAPSCLETPVVSSHRSQRSRVSEHGDEIPDWLNIDGHEDRQQAPVEVEVESEQPGELTNGRFSAAFLKAREQRRDLLIRLDDENEDDLYARLVKCGQELTLVCECCGVTRRAETSCSLKWCPVCARKRAAQRAVKYSKASENMKWPLHVTLTRCNMSGITKKDVADLKAAFQKLRRTKLWSSNVLGGIVSVELTNRGKGWHPHLHTLCDCQWLALDVRPPARQDSRARKAEKCRLASIELEREWSRLVGQLMSSIDVRRCSGEIAVREVLKYAIKPGDLLSSPDHIGDAIRAITGGRNCTPYGSLYGKRRELSDEKRPPAKCDGCGELGSLRPEATFLDGEFKRVGQRNRARLDRHARS
jgi:hypothetical protein